METLITVSSRRVQKGTNPACTWLPTKEETERHKEGLASLSLPGITMGPGRNSWTQTWLCPTAGWASWHCPHSDISERERVKTVSFQFL